MAPLTPSPAVALRSVVMLALSLFVLVLLPDVALAQAGAGYEF